jgi:uncharacterized protein (TIGR03437 family)
MSGGPIPPGAPETFPSGAYAVTGGTGAWFGVRGETTNLMRLPEATTTFRNASASEDPANRRALGGGGPVRIQFRLIPAQRPAIAVVNGAPAVTTNGRLVDASHPAAAGDIVTLYATGMGPVRQPPNAGEQFGGNPPPVIAVPVEVTLNGIAAELLYAGGYPGTTDGYQVNFRVPAGLTPGTAKLVVSNAWVPSAPAMVPVR